MKNAFLAVGLLALVFAFSGRAIATTATGNGPVIPPSVTPTSANGNCTFSGSVLTCTTPSPLPSAVTLTSLHLSAGMSTDGNTAPTNGWKCGVANTTGCVVLMTTGTTTTGAFGLNTTTACHAGADLFFFLDVNGTQELGVSCNGNLNTTGSVNAGGAVFADDEICADATGFCDAASGALTSNTTASAGRLTMGGASSSCLVDYGVTTTGIVNVGCPLRSSTSNNGAAGTVDPVLTLTATPSAITEHCVAGTVTGTTTTTTVSWNAAAAFAVAGNYSIFAIDQTTGLLVTGVTTFATTSFIIATPASVSGHNYFVRVCGV